MRRSSSMKAYETGRQAIEKGDFSAARSAFRWAAGLDPDNPVYTYAAADAAFRAGREDEAEKLFRRAMADTVTALGRAHPHLATVADGLARIYEKQGREDEVRKLSGAVIDGLDLNAAAMASSRVLRRFAGLFRRAGRPHGAVQLYRMALAFRRSRYGDSHPLVAECLLGLAEIHHHLGNREKAKSLLKLAAALAGPQGESAVPTGIKRIAYSAMEGEAGPDAP